MEIEIPGYRLVRLIAEGGMASVFLAVQESLNRNVALKLLKRFDAPAETERFLNEGRIISSLNHRNIITIHDIGLVGDRPFISMEFLEGGDLEDRLAKGIETETALDLLETTTECLDFVHNRGIIHRDIKPANILFHQDGRAILSDFGIAKELQTDTSLTMEGTAIGSPHYLSPEQASCKPLSGRADIYSLGVVFYQMIVGERPYDGSSPVDVMVAHLTEPLPQLPATHKRYQVLLNRMMAKAPEERFASAAELLACLRDLRATAPVSVAANSQSSGLPASGVSSHGNPHRTAVAASSVALAAAVVLSLAATPWLPWAARSGPPSPSAAAQHGIVGDETMGKNVGDSEPGLTSAPTLARAKPNAPSVALSAGLQSSAHGSEATLGSRPALPRPQAKESKETTADTSKTLQINRYLSSARTALAEYRLTTPRGNNAHFYLRRALELAPDNTEAQHGVVAVADAYADLVEGALDRFAYVDAKRYLARGLAVQPDNGRLLALKNRTDAHRDAPKRLVKKLKAWF